jgi:DNA-binding NtrC family response regulator
MASLALPVLKPGSVKNVIVVVESTPRLNKALGQKLQNDYRIVTAPTADEALERCREEKPTLTVLDLTDWAASGWGVIDSLMRREPSLRFLTITVRNGQGRRTKSACIIATAAQKQFPLPEMLRVLEILVENIFNDSVEGVHTIAGAPPKQNPPARNQSSVVRFPAKSRLTAR